MLNSTRKQYVTLTWAFTIIACRQMLFCSRVATSCIVSCQVVVQLGIPAPRVARGGPAKVDACKSIIFTKNSLFVKKRMLGWFCPHNLFSVTLLQCFMQCKASQSTLFKKAHYALIQPSGNPTRVLSTIQCSQQSILKIWLDKRRMQTPGF